MRNAQLGELRRRFVDRTDDAIAAALGFAESQNQFAFLWRDDREEALQRFLDESMEEEEEENNQPCLERFRERINKYEELYTEVSFN